MTPHLTAVRLGGRPDQPLLVLGPSLGTSARALWSAVAEHLAADFQVVAWDLPGHGTNTWVPEPATEPTAEPMTVDDLAQGLLAVVDEMADGFEPPRFHYAGDSVGGAVGLQLLLDAPDRVASATLLCTGARIGEPSTWQQRAATVVSSGTSVLTAASTERWFGPGFAEREPARVAALLEALIEADDTAYAAVCGALATFDVRHRLGEVAVPVLAVAGAHDVATPARLLEEVAGGVRDGRLVVLDGVAHLAPAEVPEVVARLVRGHALGEPVDDVAPAGVAGVEGVDRDARTVAELREAGTAVRKEVLGGAFVARATGQATDFTRDFQQLVTEQVWGAVWTRPDLDRRTRAAVALAALVAGGQQEELAVHVRAAHAAGLSVAEIREVLLQTAVYCGFPAANAAFRVAQQVLGDLGEA